MVEVGPTSVEKGSAEGELQNGGDTPVGVGVPVTVGVCVSITAGV